MSRLGECCTTVRFLLGLRCSISILETHRVWWDGYITVELQTIPCSGSCHHGIDLHGDLQSHKKRNQQRFTTRENRSGVTDLAIVFDSITISIGYMRKPDGQRSYTRDLTCKRHDRTWLVYCAASLRSAGTAPPTVMRAPRAPASLPAP